MLNPYFLLAENDQFQTDPKNVDLNLQARRIQFPVRKVDSILRGLTWFLTTILLTYQIPIK